ncbi:MAG TPA: formimidoylglutamate deiminase [Pyrinomonadaceae bacterium]|nr:formimidoylglutamate deiminase [Pyrinomonadaceae bacterium]
MEDLNATVWLPDLIYDGPAFDTGVALVVDGRGRIHRKAQPDQAQSLIRLKNRALLPGLVNAHSHAFQRLIRGRTEHRTSNPQDSFWTWREMMYSAANRLGPDDIYDASRMTFLEMALSGVTTVGEFHYLHHAPDGKPYDDSNLLAKEVVRAALDVGLRIALLRVAYARSGHQLKQNPQQLRFIEDNTELYLERLGQLRSDLASVERAWVGVAPHSVRAVPLDYLKRVIGFAQQQQLVVHMHVAEQPAEVVACQEEYGSSPVALLQTEGLLSERFTAVHAIHVTPDEVSALAAARAHICACPTTERNLGDGIVPVDSFFAAGAPVCLGSDSHTQIDLLEDARELEYHLRLQLMERSILAPSSVTRSALADRLFACATSHGAHSLGFSGGRLEPGMPADFFTVDLDDPSIAGASMEDLLPAIVFSLSRTAVRDVVVGGKMIVKDGRHRDQSEIVERFKVLQKRLWN